MACLTLAAIAYLLAIRELFATPAFPRRVVIVGLGMAAVWHVSFLRLPPGVDDDIHRYVWDGRLQRLGYNPYLVVPSDPAAKNLHTAETRTLNNPDLPSPYPPGAVLFFRAVTAIHESVCALKLAFVICEFGIAFVLLDFLRTGKRGAHLVLMYLWNPLLAVEVAGSGHIDIVGTLLLVISIAALARSWRAIAALALALSVAVKFLPIVLLPLYCKRVRIRDAALAATVFVLLYLPFLNHGRVPIRASAVARWLRGARGISDCKLVAKDSTRVLSRSICLADGSDAFVRPRRIPLVSALAAAISDVALESADDRVEREYYPHLCNVAPPHAGSSLGSASWLGDAGGVRVYGNCRCHDCMAPLHAVGRSCYSDRLGLCRHEASASKILGAHPTPHPI